MCVWAHRTQHHMPCIPNTPNTQHICVYICSKAAACFCMWTARVQTVCVKSYVHTWVQLTCLLCAVLGEGCDGADEGGPGVGEGYGQGYSAAGETACTRG